MTVFSKLALGAVAVASGASALRLRGATTLGSDMPDVPAGTVEVPGDGLNVRDQFTICLPGYHKYLESNEMIKSNLIE